jgi:hypothetical protein
MECYSPECCEELGVGEVDSCIIFDPDGSWIEGGSDGHFGELDDLLVFNIVLDPADDSTQGSIIVVGGHKGDILVDGAMSIPPNPPALEAILLQAELIIASMQDEELAALEDFDESRAEAAEAIDDVVAGDEQSAGSAPEGGAVHAAGGAAAPTPTPAEQERPLRPHRRGRARR